MLQNPDKEQWAEELERREAERQKGNFKFFSI